MSLTFNLAGFSVMGTLLTLRWLINKRLNLKRGHSAKNVALLVVSFVAGCGMVFTFIASIVAGIVHGVSRMSPGLGVAVPAILFLVTVGVAVLDIACDRTADKFAQNAALIAPVVLAVAMGGLLGRTGDHVVNSTYSQARAQIVKLSGS